MFRYPGEKPKFSAAELNRQNAAADRLAFRQPGLAEGVIADDTQSHWVWLRNDSGSDRERFDCMSLGDPLFEMLENGTVDLLFSADDADPEQTPVILLEPIEDGAFGRGVIHGLALARVSGGFGLTASPNDTHTLSPGGGRIKLLAPPDADDEKLLPVLLGSQTDIAAFRLLEDMPSGHGSSAYASLRNWAGEVSKGFIYNWNFSTSGEGIIDTAKAGYGGLAIALFGRWAFVQGPCIPRCDSDGVIMPGTPPTGTAGVTYTGHTVGSSGLNDDLAITDLPPGLTDDGDGVISGTPTEAGTFYAIATGTAPKLGLGAAGDCTITRAVVFLIEPEPEE